MGNRKLFVLSLAVVVLSGCIPRMPSNSSNVCNIEGADYQYCHYIATKRVKGDQPNTFYNETNMVEGENFDTWQMAQSGRHFKRLNEYSEQLSMKLVESIQGSYMTGPIAITSFVNFDHTLNNTDAIGNQLAESLIHELKQHGLNVIDFKNTNYIKITGQGDFVFSREAVEIARKQNINYVLSGTMTHSSRGIVVQARIVQLGSNRVKASAKSFIPNLVVM